MKLKRVLVDRNAAAMRGVVGIDKNAACADELAITTESVTGKYHRQSVQTKQAAINQMFSRKHKGFRRHPTRQFEEGDDGP